MQRIDKKLIDIHELCEITGFAKQTVYNKVNNYTFPIKPIKVGRSLRWRLSEVYDFIDKAKPAY